VLRLTGITVSISGVSILRGLSLSVESGAMVGLVGRNGAGKTTTMRSIVGLARTTDGSNELDGERLDRLAPHLRARLGIGYLPEDRRLVGALSVRDNLLIPAQASGIEDHEARLNRIFELMPEVASWSAG
jgi:branched-chain amino acid transport system ATP-binding protein